MLTIDNLSVFYGKRQALFDMRLRIPPGAAVALLGRNGMGKTTVVNSIMGKLPAARGEIFYNGERLNGLPPYQIARRGIGLAPEGREIFPNLNVRENLVAAARGKPAARVWTLSRVLKLFPQLKPRLGNMGGQLSGGEQQMLAIGRALLLNPTLLILDEALAGLAPLIQASLLQKLMEIKRRGIALLLIDKNMDALCKIADYHYLMEKGAIAWEGTTAALRADARLKTRYLGV